MLFFGGKDRFFLRSSFPPDESLTISAERPRRVLLLIALINKREKRRVYKQKTKKKKKLFHKHKSVIHCLKTFILVFCAACQTNFRKWLLKEMYSRSMSVCIKVPSGNIYYMHWRKKTTTHTMVYPNECYLFM